MKKNEIPPTETDGIIYEVINQNNLDSAVKLASVTFASADPLSKAVDLTPEDLEGFINVFLRYRLVSDGLSVAARDASTGEIVGCLLMKDFITDPPANTDGLSEKLTPLIALLEKLETEFLEKNPTQPGELIHVLMAGVSQLSANKGIAFNLLKKGYEIAIQKNYKAGIAEVTGAKSQHVAGKFGSAVVHEINYSEFEFEGKRPFSSIVDCDTCALMHIKL